MNSSRSLVPQALAIKAMRDNGYRNAAYALAELIDNSIQAGATSVELLCAEQDLFIGQRKRRNLTQIAVLDNGCGMATDVLEIALQFGNGTRLDDRSGMGRFGMGLPSASVSQCKRVEVWSWTNGPESANYTFIDLDEIEAGEMVEVPEATSSKVPDRWRLASGGLGKSGTLVVWSKIDRCMWRTGKAIIRNSEFLVGRMYREFIHDGRVAIRSVVFEMDTPTQQIDECLAVANDPGYLLTPSSTPAPYDVKAMFEPDGDNFVQTFQIDMQGQKHDVLLKFSVAKKEARESRNAGASPFGKHAANNVGVSLMREGRELEMDQALVTPGEYRERWWGVEVAFPASLDELFGVPNNKQAARNFTDVAERIRDIESGRNESLAQWKDELEEDGDPRYALVELVATIRRRITILRNQIQVQNQGSERARRHSTAEEIATEATAQLKKSGQTGQSDAGENLSTDERTKEIEGVLKEDGFDDADAHAIAVDAVSTGLKYVLTEGPIDGSAFFTVRPAGGEILVKINVSHPAYAHLVDALPSSIEGLPDDVGVLKERLTRAGLGLRLLLLAWARFEDEQPAERRMEIQDIRSDWGRYANRFLRVPG